MAKKLRIQLLFKEWDINGVEKRLVSSPAKLNDISPFSFSLLFSPCLPEIIKQARKKFPVGFLDPWSFSFAFRDIKRSGRNPAKTAFPQAIVIHLPTKGLPQEKIPWPISFLLLHLDFWDIKIALQLNKTAASHEVTLEGLRAMKL